MNYLLEWHQVDNTLYGKIVAKKVVVVVVVVFWKSS